MDTGSAVELEKRDGSAPLVINPNEVTQDPAELKQQLTEELQKLNSQGSTVNLTAESLYHASIYMVLLQFNWKSAAYLMVSTMLLAVQLMMLLGFLHSFFNSAVQEYIERLTENAYDQLGMFLFQTNPEFVARTLARTLPEALDPEFTNIEQTELDYIVIVAVSGIVSFNIMQEIQECFITDKMIQSVVLGRDRCFALVRFYCQFLNLIRRTFLSVFVSSVTGLVMSEASASEAILNGLAIFSILELDNLLFRALLTDFVQDHIKDPKHVSVIKVRQTEAWYIRVKSALFASACFATTIFIAMRPTAAVESVSFQFHTADRAALFSSNVVGDLYKSSVIGTLIFGCVTVLAYAASRILNRVFLSDKAKTTFWIELKNMIIFGAGIGCALALLLLTLRVTSSFSNHLMTEKLGFERNQGLQGYVSAVFEELERADLYHNRCIWDIVYLPGKSISVYSRLSTDAILYSEIITCRRVLNTNSDIITCQ